MNSVILFNPLGSGAVNQIVYQLEMEKKKKTIQIFIFICNYALVILKSVMGLFGQKYTIIQIKGKGKR